MSKVVYKLNLNELEGMTVEEMNDPLTILLSVIFDYAKSNDYNYLPDTEEDAGDYYNNLLDRARQLALTASCTENQFRIIDSIKDFISSCEGPDAINDFLLSLNPKLAYFCSPYELMEENMAMTYDLYKQGIRMKFIPTMSQILDRCAFFASMGDDKDEIFMMELASTVLKNFD